MSYLPLSHSAAQMVDIMANLVAGCEVTFARPDALQGSLVDTLKYVQPTLFFAVPRVWEKFEEKMKDIARSAGPVLRSISTWAKTKGMKNSLNQISGEGPPWGYTIAHALVLGRIKAALGLDKSKAYIYAAAPLKSATEDYFMSLDMPLLNIYGMSECAGP